MLARRPRPGPRRRAVAFWGNLSFPVNRQAVDHFFRDVWRPYLADAGVAFVVIGPHAGADLHALAAAHPGFVLPGYVDDLFGYLDEIPVMVNPMVTGGGLKNKVLEAFAASKAVVTTRLGVEAFPEVTAEHCRVVDRPAAMAEAVLSLLDDAETGRALGERARELVERYYTWPAVGSAWSELLMNLGGVQLR
ncbi:MAG: glycosyltransferase [Candidatus Krumholzibacteriia bacterium]